MAERGRAWLERLSRVVARHQALFWTLHSVWALAWGVAFMVVGAKRTWLLRYGLASIGVVWATSLVLPALLRGAWVRPERKEGVRRLVLWGQKWLLQGLAFFILPLYHRSATYPSGNTLFMALLLCAALGATIDVVYDEYVTRWRSLHAAFLAFVAFACVNLMLPMVWRVGGLTNLAASAAGATAVFLSLWASPRQGWSPRGTARVAVAGLAFAGIVAFGRAWVPPAPLRLVSARFGTSLGPDGLDVNAPLAAIPASRPARVHVVAAVQAPAGLAEGVRHVWWVDGERVLATRLITVTGGRSLGFRSRSSASLPALSPGQRVRVEVETAWGQLLGRAELPVR